MYQILAKKTKRSKRYEKIVAQYTNIDEIARHARSVGHASTTPYVFTHIPLNDGTIITQEVMGMTCSPVKLAQLLGIK